MPCFCHRLAEARNSPWISVAKCGQFHGTEEIDAIVGRLLKRLKALGIDQDTMVIFTSDNGPWYEGSSGGLRDRKGGAGYDGGYRVPCIVRQPGTVPAGRRCSSIAMGIDFLPTFCAMAGVPAPQGVELDGKDISAVLRTGAPTPHDALLLFNEDDVVAVRTQRWKYVAKTYYHGFLAPISAEYPQLYDMNTDISESYSVVERYPAVAASLRAMVVEAKARFTRPETSQPGKSALPGPAQD